MPYNFNAPIGSDEDDIGLGISNQIDGDPDVSASYDNATNKITKGKTSIIIAHRLSTVESADKIIYMESGKILEYGNHKELLNIPKGKFKKLYEEQFVENELV